jgi:hypothetical protein
MLPPLFARPPADPTEERRIRRLAAARHAPELAAARPHHHLELGRRPGRPDRCPARLPSPHRLPLLHRFNAGGIDDLGELPRSGRPRRLSELERGRIIALAAADPPGRLVRQAGGDPDFAPKGRRSSPSTPPRRRRRS